MHPFYPEVQPVPVSGFSRFLPVLLYLLYAGLVIASVQNGFFWDSILLASRYGQWYYDTSFTSLFVPENIAGYPPLFGMLIAGVWKLFGRNLLVSHLFMLPFALGIVHQVLSLSRKFFSPNIAPWAALLLLLEPTLIAQCTQVAPDVLLVFFYLFSLNKILENRRGPLIFSLIFLGMLSPRGTIAVALLFLTDLAWHFLQDKAKRPAFLKLFLSYFPAGIIVLAWLFLHYQHFGWIGYNPDSSWGAYSKFAGLKGMLRNAVIIIWRMLDFGRLAVWLSFMIAAIFLLRKSVKIPPPAKVLFTFSLIPFLGFSFVFLPYTNPIGHRYYLVVFLLFALFTFYLLTLLPNPNLRRILYGFMLAGLVTGHFWVYPDGVAKGWDASLAHLPYFNLRQEAIQYLNNRKIAMENVGSDYPNLSPLSQTDLLPDTRSFKSKDLKTDEYVLFSNIFNGFTDEEIQQLKTSWQPVESWKRGQVYFVFYRRSDR